MPRWKLAFLRSPPKACIGRLCTRESRSGEGQGRRADGRSAEAARSQRGPIAPGRGRQGRRSAYLRGSLKGLMRKYPVNIKKKPLGTTHRDPGAPVALLSTWRDANHTSTA